MRSLYRFRCTQVRNSTRLYHINNRRADCYDYLIDCCVYSIKMYFIFAEIKLVQEPFIALKQLSSSFVE